MPHTHIARAPPGGSPGRPRIPDEEEEEEDDEDEDDEEEEPELTVHRPAIRGLPRTRRGRPRRAPGG
ncbi:hypothetical protein GCM10009801_46830 [Streptomyces albiaxialis]|uniref:Uncharacterized protein n=1 Tax=Streptomyces albiaxialis TaxID=329523 RepID=A0ABP5HRU5_9ACTN